MDWEKYKHMSPFEIKNELIEKAKESQQEKMKKGEKSTIYNAGRGNPNFLNIPVREGFAVLSMFATNLSKKLSTLQDVGLRPLQKNIAQQLNDFLVENKDVKGASFLKKAVDYAIKHFKLDPDEFVFCLTDAILGDFYPMPPRIFPVYEKILRGYLFEVLGLKHALNAEEFDLFATEGGAAAMVYLFKSLHCNHIVNKKDKIAIVTPIFSPYLEMPHLKDFDLIEILLESKEELGWQIPDEEIQKLKDPSVKAIYIVNPANPTSFALNDHVIKEISKFVKEKRPDLLVLTDTVYATYVEDFHSIIKDLPHNSICVYSFSKYFGATGWRLGLIMMHKKNTVDGMIAKFSDKEKKEVHDRYKIIASNPEEIPFIERLELDSRDEALAHTGGLSCPQQTIMTLFALYELMDTDKNYKHNLREKLKKRTALFYDNLGAKMPEDKGNTYYYSLFDMTTIAKEKYGEEFAKYLEQSVNPLAFLFKLAEVRNTILLPGEGFGGPKWSFRISLANLSDESYEAIGKNVNDVLHMVFENWKIQKNI